MPFLTAAKLDSVDALWEVTHGVYVMQAVECGCLFRFGSLGLKSPNPAVCRLGQCFQLVDPANSVMERWRYVLIYHMKNSTQFKIRKAERALREEFFSMNCGFLLERITRKDRFRTLTDKACTVRSAAHVRERVFSTAKKALNSLKYQF